MAEDRTPLDVLWAEIEARMGVCPSFFKVAAADPPTARGLFDVARLAYLDSAPPADLKERLFTYLSRFCPVPYCIARHAAFLLGRGAVAGDPQRPPLSPAQVAAIVEEPFPAAAELPRLLDELRHHGGPVPEWPAFDSRRGFLLRVACAMVFLEPAHAASWNAALRRLLGEPRHEQLLLFLAFVRTAHFWTEVHPDVALEPDVEALLAEEEALARPVLDRAADAVHHAAFEATHRRSEARFRTVFENAPTGIAITDWHGRFLECNPAYAAIVGYGEGELRRRAFDTLIHPDDREENLRWLQRLQAGEIDAFEIENRYVQRGGREVWVHKFVKALPDESGTPAHLVALVTDVTERRSAEEALRESERRFRVMADGLPLIIWVHDAAGEQEFVNQTFCDYFGVSREEMQGGRWRMLTHPDDGVAYVEAFEASVREQRPFHAEVRVRRADGAWRWIESWAQPRFSDGGEFLGHVGASKDVTERKAATEQADAQRAQLEAIYEAVGDGLAVFDAQGRIVLVNEAGARLYGYANADELERDLDHFASVLELREGDGPPLPVERWPAACVLRGESLASLELHVRRRDTGQAWVISFSGEPVVDDRGEVRLGVIVSRDVTERSRAEADLRERESFYRQTLESIPGMTFTNTSDGACDYVSEQWVDFTGVPALRHLGDGWQRVLHPDDRDRVFAAWRAAVEGRGQFDLEYRVRRYDGAFGWFKVRGRPIRDGSGAVVRWIGTAVNVDDLKQAEAALRESDRRKDEFLAMLAHELRNPLAPIRNAVEVLRQLGSSEPPLARSREIILRQVTHMARLIDDLLDVSRITRGRIRLQREPLAIDEVVEAAVEAARPTLEQHQQTLSLQVAAGVQVEGDRARLVQVLTNLLTNAAKFSPPGGHVTVWTRVRAPHVDVAVADTGIGLAPDAQARIFDLFAQEDASAARSRGGLGIGLTLVKRLVEMHGGSVSVSSQGAGTGAEFAITLPMLDGSRPAEEPTLQATGASGRLRILVVEDNADTAETFRMLLELGGHQVYVASDGRQGLRALDGVDPDVAFIDLGLPGIDGLTMARRVREQRPQRPLLVAVSGYGRDEDKRQAREAGFDEHLTKPVDYQALQALLERAGQEPAS